LAIDIYNTLVTEDFLGKTPPAVQHSAHQQFAKLSPAVLRILICNRKFICAIAYFSVRLRIFLFVYIGYFLIGNPSLAPRFLFILILLHFQMDGRYIRLKQKTSTYEIHKTL